MNQQGAPQACGKLFFVVTPEGLVDKGRQKTVDDIEIRRLAADGVPKARIARDLGVSRMTVYHSLHKRTRNEVAALKVTSDRHAWFAEILMVDERNILQGLASELRSGTFH
ncbi:MAG: helix-turn-helix domain-containing protein [Loktanella sp.]|nr:helix-turn-helix domain-containing protein [Loktanella sp.]